MIIDEKEFISERKVKYILTEAKYNKQDLIVIFSAFSPIGKPPAYNYLKVLKDIDANKLYILDDFGCRASYYLCENKDFAIENSIINLIENVKQKLNIKTVISVGSSKGGYAAIYYGIKYNFQQIIAASPQFYLGNYLLKETKTIDVAKFMAGGSDEKTIEYLNNILAETIFYSKNLPSIYLHLGKYEYHYKLHVLPMTKLLDYKNNEYELDLGEYSEHNDVGKFFPSILINKLKSLLKGPELKLNYADPKCVEYSVGQKLNFDVVTREECSIAWYEYYNGVKLKTNYYSKLNNSYTAHFDKVGRYQIKAFVKNKYGRINTALSNEFIVK